LNELSRLVLVSAMYFKGEWLHPFDSRLTQEAQFRISLKKIAPVKMMNMTGDLEYAHIDRVQILELPYEGGNLSMVIFLPDMVDGLPELQTILNSNRMERWLDSLTKTKIQVSLPRFKLTRNLRLDKLLIQMGMPDAFDPDRADFSGIDGRAHWLFIQAVLHQAMIEVNEMGSEAAAAASVVFKMPIAAPSPRAVFIADHPFLFLIREKQTGSILFLGRCSEP
jgi:serpin B